MLNLFGQFVLFSVIPMILVLFAGWPARRAVIAATIISWLFLPNVGYPLPGLPDYTKTSATTVGTLLGALLFDFETVVRFRPKWYDLPMIVWCVTPFFTSLSNDLGAYDGISAAFSIVVMWGLPYLMGRIYLNTLDGCRDLAIGIVIGAVLYVPLCLWEIRMSPSINQFVYGEVRYHEPERFGFGFRPLVFLASGMEVGVWLGAGTVCAYTMWRSGLIRKYRGVSFVWVFAAIAITTLISKSVGAVIQAMIGVVILELIRWMKRSTLVWILILTPPLYMTVRTTGLWDGQSLIDLTARFVPERKSSVETRIVNENLLMVKAFERPVFGWGGFSRNFVQDKYGRIVTIADGYWIITLGVIGLVGLVAMTGAFLIPQVFVQRRIPGKLWSQPEFAPVVALSVQLGLFMVDSLSNAMPNPTYGLALGALTGLTAIGIRSPRQLAADLLSKAEALKRAGQTEPAEGTYVKAIEGYTAAASEFAGQVEPLVEAAFAYESLADLYASTPGRAGEAEPCLLRAIEIHEAIVAADPERIDGFERLATDLEHLGRLLEVQGRLAEADQTWRRTIDLCQGLAAHFPTAPEPTRRWAESLNDYAWTLASRPGIDVDTARTAADLASRAIELEPSRSGFWNTLGAANYHAADYLAADAALRRAVELTQGGTAFDNYLLSMTRARLGVFDEAIESFRLADAWARSNAPENPSLARLREQASALLPV